jgi:hypothetical protein
MFVKSITADGRTYQALVKSVWDKEKKQPRHKVIRWLGRVDDSVRYALFGAGYEAEVRPVARMTRSFRSTEEKFICGALKRNRSLLLHGSWGVGKTFLAQRIAEELNASRRSAHFFRWSSPAGAFVSNICDALLIETKEENENGRLVKRSQAALLEAIGERIADGRHVLIIDKAQQIPAALRNNFELWLECGAVVLLSATMPKRGELYLKFPRYELQPLDRRSSVELVRAAAAHLGVRLTPSQAQEIVTLGNGNPQFLIRAVAERDIGAVSDPDQAEWIDGTPLVIAALCCLMFLRFVGRGLHDENLMLMGGMALVVLRLAMLTIARVSKRRRIIE